ncbi:conjugal transfer protein TraF [Pantoea sp. 1.19]|uniref:conjugal transfer protein TraF n=1 Tax=Pantoea sp. 1.19 TaxID=1925589 RepID=UPI000948A9D0|nr:conjugal transfer protein TraF [Pantoea sp. 1.19]
MTVKIKQKAGAWLAPTLLILPVSALAAGSYVEARNDAMGGTGVASSHYGAAALANPALMTRAEPEDRISMILPAAGIRISDQDHLTDRVDDISNSVDGYRGLANGFTFADYPKLQAAAGDLAQQLRNLRGNTARGSAGASLVITVPTEQLDVAFVSRASGTASLATTISQGDIDYLQGVADGTVFPFPGDQNRLTSQGRVRAALVTDYGVAMAKEVAIAGHPISFGLTPKLQKTWLWNYNVSVYNYDKSDVTDGRNRTSDTGFNLDAGAATDVGEHWTLGLSAQNLVPRDIDTKEVGGVKDTWRMRPLVTSGVAWHTDRLTTALDVDLTPTKGFRSLSDSQYAGAGIEYRLAEWLQLRAGYRADMKGTDANVATAGVGFSPFQRVHLDLTGLAGEDRTWGAVAQLGFTF